MNELIWHWLRFIELFLQTYKYYKRWTKGSPITRKSSIVINAIRALAMLTSPNGSMERILEEMLSPAMSLTLAECSTFQQSRTNRSPDWKIECLRTCCNLVGLLLLLKRKVNFDDGWQILNYWSVLIMLNDKYVVFAIINLSIHSAVNNLSLFISTTFMTKILLSLHLFMCSICLIFSHSTAIFKLKVFLDCIKFWKVQSKFRLHVNLLNRTITYRY